MFERALSKDVGAASLEARREAASFICPSLLYPSRGPEHRFELSRLHNEQDAYIPLEVSQSLRQQRTDALAYRFFLVVAQVMPDFEIALPKAVTRLRDLGWRVRDAQTLRVADRRGKCILLLLQSDKDATPADVEEMLRRVPDEGVDLTLHPPPNGDHWRGTHVEAIRRFPWFFQAHTCSMFIPAISVEGVQELTSRLLLNNFAVKNLGHASSATNPSGEALFEVTGVGITPGQDEVTTAPTANLVVSPLESTKVSSNQLGVAVTMKSDIGLRDPLIAPLPTLLPVPASPIVNDGIASLSSLSPVGPPPTMIGNSVHSLLLSPGPILGSMREGAGAPSEGKEKVTPRDLGHQKLKLPVFDETTVVNLNLPSGTRVFADLKSFRESKAIEPLGLADSKQELETSILVVFGDACALGLIDVAREILLANGFFILLERRRKLSSAELTLLMGLKASSQAGLRSEHVEQQTYRSDLHPSLQTWLEHLTVSKHHFFVVRRFNAISLLLHICFGPSELHTKSTPRLLQWPFLDIDDSARPRPLPLFASLHHMISNRLLPPKGCDESSNRGVPVGPLSWGVRRPAVPLLSTTCHSALHASAVISLLFKELFASEEIVAVLPSTSDRKQLLTLEALNSSLAGAPISCTLLRSTGETSVMLSAQIPAPKTCLRQVELLAQESIRSTDGPWGEVAWATLVVRAALAKELHAFARLRERLPLSSSGEPNTAIVPCPLFEKYEGLLSLGAIFVSGPHQVDVLIRDLWPDASFPAVESRDLTPDFAARCVRLTDPCFGVGRALKVFPGNFLRHSLAVWEPGSLQWCSEGSTPQSAQVEVGGITMRIKLDMEVGSSPRPTSEGVEQVPLLVSMSSIVMEALRKMSLECLISMRRPKAIPLRVGALVFPRCAAHKEPLWGLVWMRDGTPWQTLGDFPQIYEAEAFPVVVVLKPPEIARIQLDGLVVRDDAAGGKVRRGWRLRAGGDLPAQISEGRLASAFSELAWGPPHRDVALIFETPGLHAPTVSVPSIHALGNSSASLHAVLKDRAVPESLVVPRRRHVAMEGLLLGATIARFAISMECQPACDLELRQAFLNASFDIVGLSEELVAMLRNDYDTVPLGWLCPLKDNKTRRVDVTEWRTLCNESAQDVAAVWRVFAGPLDQSGEQDLQTLLAPDCFGAMVAGQPSTYISLDAPLISSEVLVHFTSDDRGSHPDVVVWNSLPVFGKPGRLAAQLYVMLHLDSCLAKFQEVKRAILDGFMQTYTQEAPHFVGTGPSILRLRLHSILCTLEYDLWLSRAKVPRHESQNAFVMRGFFREEVAMGVSSFRKALGF